MVFMHAAPCQLSLSFSTTAIKSVLRLCGDGPYYSWLFNLFQAGANMIVSGSAIMKSEDPRSVINLLRNVCSEAAQKRSLDR